MKQYGHRNVALCSASDGRGGKARPSSEVSAIVVANETTDQEDCSSRFADRDVSSS